MDKVFAYVHNCVTNKEPLQPFMTLHALYGDPKYKNEAMCHHWGWFQVPLRQMLESVGMERIEFFEPRYHFPFRDMRIECYKESWATSSAMSKWLRPKAQCLRRRRISIASGHPLFATGQAL
jgi:hypothetical protein